MTKAVLSCVALFLLLSLPALSIVVQPPATAGEIALVLANPLVRDASEVAARAGLAEISPDRAITGVFVFVEQARDIDRLYESGALVVLNGEAVFALCGTASKENV